MADQILKDMTQLGSKLAEMATDQLDDVLKELRGPVGDPRRGDQDGQLAVKVIQSLSRLGDIMKEVAEYDLVRRDRETLLLDSANSLSSVTLTDDQASKYQYDVLVENKGQDELDLVLAATLVAPPAGDATKVFEPQTKALEPVRLDRLWAFERRRVSVELPRLGEGTHHLRLTLDGPDLKARHDAAKVRRERATKTVVIEVLPPPKPHTP